MIQFDNLKQIDQGSGFTINELSGGDIRHKQLRYLKNGAMVAFFDGVDTALDFIGKNMTQPRHDQSSANYGSGSFNAFDTYEQAFDIFRNKPETISQFDPTDLYITDTNEAGTDIDYDVVGDYIDMGRYMEGIPESVGTMHGGKSRNRRVNITIQLNQGSHVSQQDINNRSVRILRLVDALEHGGVRTSVTAVDSSQCGHTEIVLKTHADTLTIPDIAVVTHSEFKRRIIFRINEYSKTWDDGYGRPTDFREALTPEKLQGELNDEINVFITGGMQNRSYNDEPTIDELFDQLEKLLVWELSKPVPEVSAIKLDGQGIYFEANGARAEDEVQREGREVIDA